MVLYEAMRSFAREFNLPEKVTEESAGVYTLPVEEEVSVEIRDTPPGFFLFSAFTPMVEEKKEEWFIHLLNGNLLGQSTSGAVLGLSLDGKDLTLSLIFDYSFSYEEFRENLEEFLNTIDYWKEEKDLFQKGRLKT
jgi:hypothetical protein